MRRSSLLAITLLLALAVAVPLAAAASSSLGGAAAVAMGDGAAVGGASEASTFSLLGLGLAGLALFPRSRFE